MWLEQPLQWECEGKSQARCGMEEVEGSAMEGGGMIEEQRKNRCHHYQVCRQETLQNIKEQREAMPCNMGRKDGPKKMHLF